MTVEESANSEPIPSNNVSKKKAKKIAHKSKHMSNQSSPTETKITQAQNRKRKIIQDSLQDDNGTAKLDVGINQDQSVDKSSAKIKKSRLSTKKKSDAKNLSGPCPENSEEHAIIASRPTENIKSNSNVGPKDFKTQKRQKKRSKNKKITTTSNTDHSSRCIEYLNKWKNDRSSWKFEKTPQTRLFSVIFQKEAIPKGAFKIFLEYMETGSESSKNRLKSKASDIVAAMEKWNSLSEEEKSETSAPEEFGYKRARSILQHFE